MMRGYLVDDLDTREARTRQEQCGRLDAVLGNTKGYSDSVGYLSGGLRDAYEIGWRKGLLEKRAAHIDTVDA